MVFSLDFIALLCNYLLCFEFNLSYCTMTAENNENAVNGRPLVNGTSLPKYIGKHVSLIGVVILVNPQGTSFDVKTSDMQIVTVSMRSPLREPVTGIVEVHGVVQGRNSIICNYYMAYPKEIADTYDQDILQETVQIIQNVQTPWTEE